MKTYEITGDSNQSRPIVKELNACVLPLTFTKSGVQQGDFYRCRNSANVIVGHKTCAPCDGEFVETVQVNIGR